MLLYKITPNLISKKRFVMSLDNLNLPRFSKTYTTDLTKTNKLHTTYQLITISSKDHLKPQLFNPMKLSSGELAKLYISFLNQTGKWQVLRRAWSLWLFMIEVVNKFQISHSFKTLTLTTWSLRTRRLLKLWTGKIYYLTIYVSFTETLSKKRRIKRWLKKKYTTTMWR